MLVNIDERVLSKVIEEIYHNYVESSEYVLGQQHPEAVKSLRDILEYMQENTSNAVCVEIEDMIGSVATAYEKMGFLNGFKYAASIMSDQEKEQTKEDKAC